MMVERKQRQHDAVEREHQRGQVLGLKVELCLQDVVDIDLLLVAVAQEVLRRRDGEEALPPTDLLEAHGQAEEAEGEEKPLYASVTQVKADADIKADQAGRHQKGEGQPFDRAILAHEVDVAKRVVQIDGGEEGRQDGEE